jgi:phosphoribosyl-AMP cyclohydrolase
MWKLNFNRTGELNPAIMQDRTQKILMSFKEGESLTQIQKTSKATFFTQIWTKNRLRTKGDESERFLNVVSIIKNYDEIKRIPKGD